MYEWPTSKDSFGNNAAMRLLIPKIVNDYKFNMGRVDVADQLCAICASHMPSQRTWMPLRFWMLDTCTTNAYIILKKLRKDWLNNHRGFIVD